MISRLIVLPFVFMLFGLPMVALTAIPVYSEVQNSPEVQTIPEPKQGWLDKIFGPSPREERRRIEANERLLREQNNGRMLKEAMDALNLQGQLNSEQMEGMIQRIENNNLTLNEVMKELAEENGVIARWDSEAAQVESREETKRLNIKSGDRTTTFTTVAWVILVLGLASAGFYYYYKKDKNQKEHEAKMIGLALASGQDPAALIPILVPEPRFPQLPRPKQRQLPKQRQKRLPEPNRMLLPEQRPELTKAEKAALDAVIMRAAHRYECAVGCRWEHGKWTIYEKENGILLFSIAHEDLPAKLQLTDA